jgi:hypothetical protein
MVAARRWVFNIMVALSLVIFVVTVGLWVRSYSVSDWLHSSDRRWVESDLGHLNITWRIVSSPAVSAAPWTWESSPAGSRILFDVFDEFSVMPRWHESRWSFLGLTFVAITVHGSVHMGSGLAVRGEYYVRIPYWILCLATLPVPLVWLIRRLRVRRYAAGHCQVCGYDLRASNERCPECGTVIPLKVGGVVSPRGGNS